MNRVHKTGLILVILILAGLLQACGKSDTDKEKQNSQETAQVVRGEQGTARGEAARPEAKQKPAEKPAKPAQSSTPGKQATAEQPASPAAVGRLVLVRGKVYVKRHQAKEPLVASVGAKVYLNDRIITSKDGYARMRMRDDSILRIAPTSELAVTTQLIGPEHNNTTIDLLKGKLRAIVVHKLVAGDSYEVKTDVAVAGVRGTDFEVIAGRGTVVRCYTGVVAITNVDAKVTGDVLLTPRTYTVVAQEKPPITPKLLPTYIVPMQDPPPPPQQPLESDRAPGKPPTKAAAANKLTKPRPTIPFQQAPAVAGRMPGKPERETLGTRQAPEPQAISQEQANKLMDRSFQLSQQNLRDSNVQRLWEQDVDKPLHELLYGDGLEGFTMNPAK